MLNHTQSTAEADADGGEIAPDKKLTDYLVITILPEVEVNVYTRNVCLDI